MSNWTVPFHGVTHLEQKPYRVTVCAYEGFAVASFWTPGCGFSPRQKDYHTAEEAKEEGEEWLDQQFK